jgi:mannitol-1-phosphate 5-dehydrogenase
MALAVQFGAGNIGRGFMGQLFFEAGFDTTFVEYSRDLVTALNDEKRYTLRLLDAYSKREIDMEISRFQVLHTGQVDEIADSLSAAHIAGTAVGVKSLADIAPLIAAGIGKRLENNDSPLDIYLCENAYRAAGDLKGYVMEHLDRETVDWAERNIGFVGTSVARMVPAPSERFSSMGPLFVVADSYHQLPFDGSAARGEQPPIEGMKPVRNFKAEVERKLFTHNLGHAAMGYIGYLKGYSYVHEPFEDEYLAGIFEKALDETTAALLRMYPDDLDPEEQREIRRDVRIRFSNPMIMDSVQRVARDPLRKLGPEDRLIGSARLCLDQGIFPEHIAFICGAAYCYDYAEDPDAVALQKMIREHGIEDTLNDVSGVDGKSDLGKKILQSYEELQKLRTQWREG